MLGINAIGMIIVDIQYELNITMRIEYWILFLALLSV
jgi:hypothetical protein